MEIERINENTIKFYISYLDIEDRGFEREEIWYDREKSEQLFWQMMDEVNQVEDFSIEGPLWIQVQAREKGLEIIVTKAQLTQDGQNLQLPVGENNTIEFPVSEKIEEMLEGRAEKDEFKDAHSSNEENFWLIAMFDDFEDIIQASYYVYEEIAGMKDILYVYQDKYYLYLEFDDLSLTDHEQEDIMSKIFEFAEESEITFYVLEEYGKKIFKDNSLKQIRAYFPLNS